MPTCGELTKSGHPCRGWILMEDGCCLEHSKTERARHSRDLKRYPSISLRHELEIFKKLVRGVEGKLRKKAEDKIRELEKRLASESGKKK